MRAHLAWCVCSASHALGPSGRYFIDAVLKAELLVTQQALSGKQHCAHVDNKSHLHLIITQFIKSLHYSNAETWFMRPVDVNITLILQSYQSMPGACGGKRFVRRTRGRSRRGRVVVHMKHCERMEIAPFSSAREYDFARCAVDNARLERLERGEPAPSDSEPESADGGQDHTSQGSTTPTGDDGAASRGADVNGGQSGDGAASRGAQVMGGKSLDGFLEVSLCHTPRLQRCRVA